MKTVNRIIDFLQAQFPPNRIVVLLGGLLTAVSATVSAWLAAHFPGLDLGPAEVAGVLGAAALITIRLLDRWIDQWQKEEPIDFPADLGLAVEDLAEDPAVEFLLDRLASVDTIVDSMRDLRAAIEAETVKPAAIAEGLGRFADELSGVLHNFEAEEPAPSPEGIPAQVEPEQP